MMIKKKRKDDKRAADRKGKKKDFAAEVLAFLEAHPDQSYKARDLANKMGVGNREYQGFKRLVKALAEEEKVARFKGNRYGMIRKATLVEGVLHVKTQGYGFLRRKDEGEDIFVSEKNMASALHGDRVKVSIWAQPVGKLAEGRVIEIIERGHSRIVGTFQEARRFNYVVPDELKISRDILVQEEDRSFARAGQKVVVEITRWSDGRRMPEGKVVEVLGDARDRGVDILSVIHSLNLPGEFPKKVEEESEKIPDTLTDSLLEGRLDLRDKMVFTIDPVDAKDFDDAVSLEKKKDGRFVLGVHIADVSRYVAASSAVDREALKRGTSIYMVDRVIPMLPERLSNHICSLKPGVDRLTYSVIMELSPEGEVEDVAFRESVIRSRFRMTYEEVQGIINQEEGKAGASGGKHKQSRSHASELKSGGRSGSASTGKKHGHMALPGTGHAGQSGAGDGKYPGDLVNTLMEMIAFSRTLKKRWHEQGSIDFSAPEVEVIFDKKGWVEDIRLKEPLESYRLIETFMLMANRCVAEHIHFLRGSTGGKYHFVYRVHEKPDQKKLSQFVPFVQALGYTFQPGKKVRPRLFQDLLKQVEGTPHEVLVEELAIRTMMKAMYSTQNAGHFGLAFKHYTHFTSPIRRYPDLIVHRLLKAYTSGHTDPPKLAAGLNEICEISSEREIVAQEAERESMKAKKVEFMESRIGEEFDGVISGVMDFGIFVEIPRFLIEGLVHVNDLADDYYIHDEKQYCLKGQNTGKTYRLGDQVRIRVARVLREMRKLDFTLVESE